MVMNGLWEALISPSAVDWCEPNFVVLPAVAEFFNTLSSLPMAALGAYGAWRWRSALLRFRICFAGLAVVGLGSAGFHGTLLRGPQALDELPMIYLGLVGVWIVLQRRAPIGSGRLLGWAFAAIAIAFTVAYWTIEEYFSLFVALYGVSIACVTIGSAIASFRDGLAAKHVRLFWGAALGFLGGLTLFWMPEHVFLPCDHPLQSLHLHSIWHLCAGVGVFLWTRWAMADRELATSPDA